MAFYTNLFATATFVSFVVLAPFVSAQAGQLFPPSNLSDPAQSCPNGATLSWNGASGSVDCTPIATSSNCESGVASGVSGGAPVCVDPTPQVTTTSCPAGQFMVQITGGTPVCAMVQIQTIQNSCYGDSVCTVSCPDGTILTGGGCFVGDLMSPSSSYPQGNGWYCSIQQWQNANTFNAYALCMNI